MCFSIKNTWIFFISLSFSLVTTGAGDGDRRARPGARARAGGGGGGGSGGGGSVICSSIEKKIGSCNLWIYDLVICDCLKIEEG